MSPPALTWSDKVTGQTCPSHSQPTNQISSLRSYFTQLKTIGSEFFKLDLQKTISCTARVRVCFFPSTQFSELCELTERFVRRRRFPSGVPGQHRHHQGEPSQFLLRSDRAKEASKKFPVASFCHISGNVPRRE